MKKRLVSIILTAFLVLSMMPFAAFADNAIVCPACGGSVTKQERRLLTAHDDFYKCDKCGKWAWANKLGSLSLFSVGDQQILDAADSSAFINFSFNNGKLIPAEKVPSGIGRKDLPGYADDKGSADINHFGEMAIKVPSNGIWGAIGFYDTSYNGDYFTELKSFWDPSSTFLEMSPSKYRSESGNSNATSVRCEPNYMVEAPYTGIYRVYAPYFDSSFGTYQYIYEESLKSSFANLNRLEDRTINSSVYVDKNSEYVQIFCNKGDAFWVLANINNYYGNARQRAYQYCSWFKMTASPYVVAYVNVLSEGVSNKTSITINNNTWNGNIYVDNSNNLTYIYPQYTTINEKNETVTNISNTPIIYNNETKQYYTYDSVTNNYYYITYEQPSPSPTPAPTWTPGGGATRGGGVGRHPSDTDAADWTLHYYVLNNRAMMPTMLSKKPK